VTEGDGRNSPPPGVRSLQPPSGTNLRGQRNRYASSLEGVILQERRLSLFLKKKYDEYSPLFWRRSVLLYRLFFFEGTDFRQKIDLSLPSEERKGDRRRSFPYPGNVLLPPSVACRGNGPRRASPCQRRCFLFLPLPGPLEGVEEEVGGPIPLSSRDHGIPYDDGTICDARP